jgi:membrane fusion protein, copper/silver efflux system
MTNKQKLAAVAAAIAMLAAAGWGVFRIGQHSAMGGAAAGSNPAAPVAVGTAPVAKGALPQSIAEGEEATRRHMKSGIKAGDVDPANGHKVLYYHDPMVPGNKFDKPAKSPFMDMMLVPVYAGADGDQGNVTVSPRIQQNLGVRTALASETMLSPQVTAVGSIAFNEREQAVIQARATGYVERLHVRATLDRVAKGQALAELYVPDWVAAQQEFLSVRRLQGPDVAPLVEGAKARMRLAGMTEEQIRGIETSGRVSPRTTVIAPSGGLVTEIAAREGMAVMPGATLFRISGFSTVWANAEVPESQAALLRPGARVKAQTPATPGVVYEGRVQALLPDVSATTRTLKARVELANPRGQLVPGMFVSMNFSDMRPEKSIVVPSEAVIYTGKRTVVIVAEDNGRFRPVEVQAGIESGGQTEIRKGLQAGQRVVVSSQFLIDSEASLKGVEARLNNEPAPAAAAAAAAPRHQGEAKIEAIDKDTVTLSHGPIPSLKWGPMTMDFKLPPPNQLPRNLAPGDRVAFEFFMGKEGPPQITHISPSSAPPPSAAASSPAQGAKQ